MRSLLKASCSGVPIDMVGTLEWSVYSSFLRLTRSILTPCILTTAVSRCLLYSLLLLITSMCNLFSASGSDYFNSSIYLSLIILANSSPYISSRDISMSLLSLPMSLSLTQPPATLRVVCLLFS